MLIENVQKILKEIEDHAQAILQEAGAIAPSFENFSRSQSKSIQDLTNGLRGWMQVNLGEAKNEFGCGIKQELEENKS